MICVLVQMDATETAACIAEYRSMTCDGVVMPWVLTRRPTALVTRICPEKVGENCHSLSPPTSSTLKQPPLRLLDLLWTPHRAKKRLKTLHLSLKEKLAPLKK